MFVTGLQVNLGVMMKDENKLSELLEILKYLHAHVPTDSSDSPDHKLCFGKFVPDVYARI